MIKTLEHSDFTVVYHEFSENPLSDSCWSTQTGPDGCIYAACCVEHLGGQTVTVVRYNAERIGGKLPDEVDVDDLMSAGIWIGRRD